MKISRMGMKRFLIALLTAVFLAGCTAPAVSGGKDPTEGTAVSSAVVKESEPVGAETNAGAGTAETDKAAEASTAAETTAAETTASQTQPESTVDRYEEIIDRNGDDGKLCMYFLDLEVGPDAKDKSGDSTILISPDGKVMLLDAGHPDSGPIVVQALKDLGVEKIDYLVTSHPHIDHIGGVPAVVKAFPVETAYNSYVEYTTKTYDNYVNALKDNNIETICLSTGDSFDFGEKVKVEVLGPDKEIQYPDSFPKNSTQFMNDHSLLLKFTYGETTALFGGDLYTSQEREYMDQYGDQLHVDVAKANHHGKDTSNSKKWITAVSPQIVVAMGDALGSMTVYDNYVKEGAQYHHPEFDGEVKVIVDDKKIVQVIDQKDSWLN